VKYSDELMGLKGRKVIIARIISRLTPAPLINLFVGAIISYTSPIGLGPVVNPIISFIICIILMVILPVIPIIFEAWRGNVDLDISDQEKRAKFFVFALVCYLIASIVYWTLECEVMLVLALSYFTVTSGVMFATFHSKVSVHVAGVSGPGTALLIIYGFLASPVIILWLLVIWARLTLKQHSMKEVLIGLFLGICITIVTYTVFYTRFSAL
jgi:membrane-associated phospholipid phosphatase